MSIKEIHLEKTLRKYNLVMGKCEKDFGIKFVNVDMDLGYAVIMNNQKNIIVEYYYSSLGYSMCVHNPFTNHNVEISITLGEDGNTHLTACESILNSMVEDDDSLSKLLASHQQLLKLFTLYRQMDILSEEIKAKDAAAK